VDTLWNDVRYALRTLLRSPGFTAIAVLMLALGIGANTAIFTVVNSVLLRELPYADPEGIVVLRHQSRELSASNWLFSPQDLEDLRERNHSFDRLAAYWYTPGQSGLNLGGDGEPLRMSAAFVSEEFFDVLGVGAKLGRTFTPEEATPGRDRVLVLSHALWQRRFGGDPGIVGQTITVDGEPLTVAGIMPAAFGYPAREVDVWMPLSRMGEDDVPHRRGVRWLMAVGRLAAGSTKDAAAADVDAVLGALAGEYPETNAEWTRARLTSLREEVLGDVRTPLLVLLGAVGLILLIACANLANLFLARGAVRSREVAVRAALGAPRGRLVRQLLTECLLLAGIGGAAGVLIAVWGVDALVGLMGDRLQRPESIALDGRVLAFAIGVTALAGIAAGLAPSLRVSTVRPATILREGGRAGTRGRGPGVRGTLVVGETALAVLLLSGAGLMLNSLWNLLRVDPGFVTEEVLSLGITIPDHRWRTTPELEAARDRILDRIRQVPGVVATGGSKGMLLHGGGEAYRYVDPKSPDQIIAPEAGTQIVTPGYFEALGIPVLRGRTFDDRDGRSRDRLSLIVNRSFASHYWPDEDPIGKALRISDLEFQVVGVVADVHHDGLTETPGAAVYAPAPVAPRSTIKLFVRTAAKPRAMIEPIRQAIREADPEQPVYDVAPMGEVVRSAVAQPRVVALLLGSLSALALILAAGGLYGVVSYTVTQRTREIGIRMALGARPGVVRRSVLGEAGRLAALGCVIGVASALAASRLIAGMLFGVSPTHPASYAAVVLILGLTSLLAGYVPARRATKVDPMVALRSE
jgi:predicted permease